MALSEILAESSVQLHARQTEGGIAPNRHPQRDFFIADILDCSPKLDMASMEHPLFALRAGDTRVRTYTRNGATVTIKPGPDGCATIHDKDVWIYCISQLVEAINRGRKDVSRSVQFTIYDFLVATNRPTNGGKKGGYIRAAEALERLKGTTIQTNIETDGKRERSGFGLIDQYKITERDVDGRMSAVEVALPDWLFRSVRAKQVLTLSGDYFRLRKPLERRIYELARKHCGAQPRWRVGLIVLHEKTGSTSSLAEFRRLIKALSEANALPDYRVVFEDVADAITFYARTTKGAKAHVADILSQIQSKNV